jgi:hypothetical protein
MADRSQHVEQIMENQTHFDLNASIENWKSELSAQSNFSADDRRELETHLRDTIAGLRQRGLNDEEIFWLARRRIGQPQQLGEEFVKADPAKVWRERVFWMVTGCLVVDFWMKLVCYIPMHNGQSYPILGYVYVLMYYLPPILFALMLAKCGTKKIIFTFISSRRRFAIFSMSGVILICISQAFIEYKQSLQVHTPHANAMDLMYFQLFSNLIWPLALIALLAWLMSPQNRKIPKRA